MALVVGAIVLAAVVGCGKRKQPAAGPSGGAPTEMTTNRFQGTPEERWPDPTVARAVNDALLGELGPSAAQVNVTVKHGVVLLSGAVDTVLAGQASIAAAEAIRGVRAVVDQMRVNAPRRPDPALARDVREALRTNATTRSRGIDVNVAKGMVVGQFEPGTDGKALDDLRAAWDHQ